MTPNAPTPGQINMLHFFSAPVPASKAEAHEQISRLLENPTNARRWLVERARRCVYSMQPAVSGAGGHNATFAVACALVHGFALSISEAMPIMLEFNARCSPPWSERELDYKLRSADKASHENPRGHLVGEDFKPQVRKPEVGQAKQWAAPLKVNFDPVKLQTLAANWRGIVNLPWLANRSVVDPATVSAGDFLKLLYTHPAEKILCFTNQKSQGQALWPQEPAPQGSPDGVWYLPQPVSGELLPNPRTGKPSRRSEESVQEFRYMVFESDEADAQDWLGFIVQLPLRIDAIYTSGGRSVHALVRVDCRTKREWDAYKEQLGPTVNLLCLGGADPKALTAVRLTRLPGCWRGDRLQKLLYVRPNAPVRPLCELPALRDVVQYWCAVAALGVSDAEEDDRRVRMVIDALSYYGPASKPCREALTNFKKACVDAGFDVGT